MTTSCPKWTDLARLSVIVNKVKPLLPFRRQHPAVESAINKLEHRGLDRVRSKGREGFARTVALSLVSLNVHRLGRLVRQQMRERHRLAA